MIRNLSKFKPLLVFFACICIFFSLSCVCACEDIDNATWEDQGAVNNDLDDGADIFNNISSDADITVNSSDEISDDVHHYKNHNFIDGGKKIFHFRHGHMTYLSHKNDFSVGYPMNHVDGMYGILTHQNNPINCFSANQIAEFNDKICNDVNPGISIDFLNMKGLSHDQKSIKSIVDNGNGICIANNIVKKQTSTNSNNLVNNAVKSGSDLIQGDLCCSKGYESNQNLNTEIHDQKIMDDSKVLMGDNVVVDNDVDDDLSYFYEYDAQINASKLAVVSIRSSNEEDMDKTLILKKILVLCQDLEQINVEDYNLEYYIFTNPYIIAENVNFNYTPISNIIQNHSFNANQTTTPNINQENSIFNIETNFNQEFLIKNLFFCDYYGKSSAFDCTLINNAIFCKNITSLMEEGNSKDLSDNVDISIGQTHINLSGGNDMATILILGVIFYV